MHGIELSAYCPMASKKRVNTAVSALLNLGKGAAKPQSESKSNKRKSLTARTENAMEEDKMQEEVKSDGKTLALLALKFILQILIFLMKSWPLLLKKVKNSVSLALCATFNFCAFPCFR